ncbi:hypothetical protein [Shewanella goraebulensis]|uniref:hypothetical protein n=1 Tax=Shewanella goraebulensis TaxID=3050637 RepID=UPI00254A944C|nr:hypothetical protein [Shewanella goraebulensis]
MKTYFNPLLLSLFSFSAILSNQVHAEDFEFDVGLGWDSKYISEGRNNLADGGVYLGGASVTSGDLTTYAAVVRGDTEHYTEWNFGLEYALHLHEDLETIVGYQRLEFYGDERGHDNEFFAEIAYTGVNWLIPSIAYTYATEAGGYFVEVSLHSPWQLTEQFSVTPYITQGFDFQYATEKHNGANHFQMGVEASYALSSNMTISAHFSHVIAMDDIKKEAEVNGYTGSLDESYGGIHLSWSF